MLSFKGNRHYGTNFNTYAAAYAKIFHAERITAGPYLQGFDRAFFHTALALHAFGSINSNYIFIFIHFFIPAVLKNTKSSVSKDSTQYAGLTISPIIS